MKIRFLLAIILAIVSSPLNNVFAQTTTFSFTGAPQTYTVPPCATTLTLVVAGAKGGGINGGNGARITTTLAVTPGQVVTVVVGGTASGITGGYNGGANGVAATIPSQSSFGGGGASSVTLPNSATLYVVAAGGGGTGGGNTAANGGAGGCITGISGGAPVGFGGAGASQSGGGNGGPGIAGGSVGAAGVSAIGGAGAFNACNLNAPGGGGGGGYFGGGGGGSNCNTTGSFGGGGGGGGSSLIPASSSCISGFNTTGNGSVTITPSGTILPTFTQVPPICLGGTLNPLPTTSNNGLIGVWSPAMNNLATTTYTFVPNPGQCGINNTMTITVNPTTTPTFNQVPPICSGGSFTLPTTSTNGIIGTWSPAINNTTTTLYTFTPNPGGCGTTATMTVTVNNQNTIASGGSQTVCLNTAMTPINLPTTSATGATFSGLPAGISGLWAGNVAVISGTPTTSGTFNYTVTTTGGCPPASTTGTLIVSPQNTIAAGQNRTVCINSAMTSISLATTGATGATFSGLPAGVTGSWAGNTVTISGTPTAAGNFNYTVTTTGGCPPATTTGIISVIPQNTISSGTSQTICLGTAISTITLITTGATGATFTGLPAGVSGTWGANTVTIFGTPTAAGTFNYTVTTTGGCPPATTTGTITVNSQNTIATGTSQTVCINTPMTTISLATTSATGATFSGLPAGVTGTWLANVATISGMPTVTGTFNYTVTTTGGCPPATATGTITVNAQNTIATGTSQTVCNGAALTAITLATTGATGATFTGLPAGVTGSWSGNVATISGTPTASGTFNYTVTTTGGCPPATATGTITVGTNSTPAFTQVAPICTGSPLSALPTTSNNGITGTWSPAINNTATTTYTFTPTAGQCTTGTTTMTITVNQLTAPAFTQVPAICPGGVLNPLPTTSNNGILGTWSPAMNNAATTTYTFTPNAGQCASTASMTITVSPNSIIPAFTQVASICTGAPLSPLPTTSTNGIVGVWSPAINNTATTTYTFTPNVAQCAATATMTITVSQNSIVPTFTQVAPICQGEVLSPLPTTSTNAISGSWSPAMNNNATTTYTFTPNPAQCAVNGTMTITVSVLPAISAGVYGDACSNDANIPLAGTPVGGTFSGTGVAANSFDPSAGTQTITYTYTDGVGCVGSNTAQILVNQAPTVSAGIDESVCVGSTVTLNGSGAIGYTWNNGITDNQAFVPVLGTTNYTVTGTDANGCSNTDIVSVTALAIPVASFSQSATSGLVPINVVFQNTSANATSFDWDFGNGESTVVNSLANQNSMYDLAGFYTITLTASNGICSDETTSIFEGIEPKPISVIQPNVFTPNGDGANDEFFLIMKNAAQIKLTLINRWGDVVYVFDDLLDTWNGITNTGGIALEGVYFYNYEVTGVDGDSAIGQGFVTLSR